MNRFKIITVVFFIGLLSLESLAQQDALFSQYMFNPLAINPAYAGSRNTISGVLLHRNQWTGMIGAPKTVSLAVHSPIKGKNFGLGLNLLSEKIGPTENSTLLGTYAYHLDLAKGKISFGLRGGFYSTVLKNDLLNYTDDTGKETGNFKSTRPNFDFGTYYHTDKFYAGLSANHLGKPKFEKGNSKLILSTHYMAFIGNAFVVNKNLVIKPSGMLKYTSGAPLNYDINASVLLKKVLWLGASFRSSLNTIDKEASLIFISEFNITQSFRVGYSYDLSLGAIKGYNDGSHEIFLGADLYSKRKKINLSKILIGLQSDLK